MQRFVLSHYLHTIAVRAVCGRGTGVVEFVWLGNFGIAWDHATNLGAVQPSSIKSSYPDNADGQRSKVCATSLDRKVEEVSILLPNAQVKVFEWIKLDGSELLPLPTPICGDWFGTYSLL